jgi:peptide/nickel transport system substrate-binding protein
MSQPEQRITRRRVLALAGAATVVACTPTGQSAPSAPASAAASVSIKRGGTLNWGEPADPITFDPHTSNAGASTVLRRMIYESFTRHNPRTMAVEPALATKWEYTKPTELVWTLRENVVFHNGQPFTADDAKWNLDRMLDPKTANPFASLFDSIESTRVVSKYVLTMTLKSADPVLPGKFATTVVSGFAPSGSIPTSLASKPIGTGPYKFVEWVQNDHVTLIRNGEYWDTAAPNIDTMNVKILPQEDSRIAALRAGTIDFSILTADGAKRLAGTSTLKFIKGVHGTYYAFKLNQRFKPFQDVRVRRAMDLAIDRNDIIDKALGGSGTITGPIVYGWEDYGIPPAELPYKTDLDQAKKLMADAGYANGFEVTGITLPEGYGGAPSFFPTLVTAAESWKKLGITVKVTPVEIGTWLQKNNSIDYDLIMANKGFRGDPFTTLRDNWRFGANDNPGYKNAEVEAWLDQAAVEQDRLKRRDLYLKIQKKVLDESGFIFVYAVIENYAMQNYVMGYDHVPFDAFKDLMRTTWLDK